MWQYEEINVLLKARPGWLTCLWIIANTRSMFALLYQFWSYILSPENDLSQFTVAAILDETGTSKFIARLTAKQMLLSNFTSQNDCFTITSMKKCTIKYVTLQQFSFLLKICLKR